MRRCQSGNPGGADESAGEVSPSERCSQCKYVARVIKMDIVSDSTLQDTQEKNHISALIVTNVSDYLDLELFT